MPHPPKASDVPPPPFPDENGRKEVGGEKARLLRDRPRRAPIAVLHSHWLKLKKWPDLAMKKCTLINTDGSQEENGSWGQSVLFNNKGFCALSLT